MKKFLLLATVFMFATISYAQTKTSFLLQEGKVANVKLIDGTDTTFAVYISFQNADYKVIEDIKSLLITSEQEFKDFKSDLKKAIDYPDTDSDMVTFKGKEWEFTKQEGTINLTVDGGWCCLKDNIVNTRRFYNETLKWAKPDDAKQVIDEMKKQQPKVDEATKMYESINKCVFK